MISSACHEGPDTQTPGAGAHPFLTGGQALLDTQIRHATGQPFNAGRANCLTAPKIRAPALHPFHAAGHASTDTQRKSASGNLLRSPANQATTPRSIAPDCTPLRRRAILIATPNKRLPAATYTQGDNHA